MEPLSLAIGIAGLYSASIDSLDRIKDYHNFARESSTTVARFEASKLRLQSWAKAVGISDHGLTDSHDVHLDDRRISSVVRNVLYWTYKHLQKIEGSASSLRIPKRQQTDGEQWLFPSHDGGAEAKYQQKISKKGRLAWSTGSKTKLTQDVQQFEELVNILHDVVSPRDDREDGETNSSHLEEKLDLLADVGLERLLELATTGRQGSLDEWLDAAKDDDQYDKFLNKCLDGTCEWILSHPSYLAWEKRDEGEEIAKILWIHGPAGFGKTILCASLIRYIKDVSQRPLVYCFSSSHARNADGLSGVIRTWLTQLVRLDKGAFDITLQLSQERKTRRASNEDVWTLLSKTVVQIQDCVLVLDGLDEFQSIDDQRKIFLSRLKNCLQSTTSSALITSRSEFDINSELRPSVPEIDRYSILECKISEDTVKSDLDAYASSIVNRRLPGKGDSLRRELSARMAERCQGQFLWLKLQQGPLRNSNSPKSLRRAIEIMPQGLHSTYERSWSSIEDLEEPDRSRAINILRWLTFALQPLTVQALAEAMLINLNVDSKGCSEDDLPDDIDDEYIDGEIKQLCGSLVEVQSHDDPGSRVVRLVHASASEFLAFILPPPFLISAPTQSTLTSAHHSILAACCICFLDSAETWLPASGRRDPSFRTYAVNTWFRHLLISRVYYDDISNFVVPFVKPGNYTFEMWKREFERCAPSSDLTATSFYYAAKFGLIPTMVDLHDNERVDVNAVGGKHGTALQAVCAGDDIEAFDLLMHWHADPAIRAGDFGSALNAAAFCGNIHMIERLLHTVTLANLPASELHEVIRLAAAGGSLEPVRLLVDRGASVDPPEALYPKNGYCMERFHGTTPLLAAVIERHVEVLRLLLERGADPNLISLPDEAGWTALFFAVVWNCCEAVELLLLHGADVNFHMSIGTPLYLVSRLCDNDAYNEWQQTPIDSAGRERMIAILTYLLHAGANPNVHDELLHTPLHFASRNGSVDTAKALVENGATIDAYDKWKITPLHDAAAAGSIDVLAFLLHKGANSNSQDVFGWTPLCVAAEKGESNAIITLLDHGPNVNINAQTNQGFTPLVIAIKNYQLEIARLLIDRGADINFPGKDGETALKIALAKSDDEFVCDLIRLGADLGSMDHYGMTCSNWLQRARPHLMMPEVKGYEADKNLSGPDMSVLRGTLLGLAKGMKSGEEGLDAYYLARCFLLLDLEDHARRAYNFRSIKVHCDSCGMDLVGKVAFFACKFCPTGDFCEPCLEGHSEKTRQKSCLSHEFLKIMPLEPSDRAGDDDEAFKKWLDDIIEQFTD